jgi:cytosine/adenosine deaminase-related metal-dependent hydrolase
MKRISYQSFPVESLIKKYQNHRGKIKFLLGPTGVQWCSDDLLRKVKKEAEKRNIGIHLHLQESLYQQEYGYRTFGKSPLQHLDEIGFLGPEVSLAHSVWLSERDIKLLAESEASVVHNPSSNLRLFNGIAPVTRMIKQGVNVALGIDGTGINDEDDILQEIRLCSIIHRKPGMHKFDFYSKTLKPSKLLDMATVNGAQATGFADEIGSIKKGAKADLVLIDSNPIQDYISNVESAEEIIINWVKKNDIRTVIVDGDIVMQDNKFLQIDKKSMIKNLMESKKESELERMESLKEYRGYLKRFYEKWTEE